MRVKRIDVNGMWKVLMEDDTTWLLKSSVVQAMTDFEYDRLLTFIEVMTRKRDVTTDELIIHGFKQVS